MSLQIGYTTADEEYFEARWLPVLKWMRITNIFALGFLSWVVYQVWLIISAIFRLIIFKGNSQEKLNAILVVGNASPLVNAILKELAMKYQSPVTIVGETKKWPLTNPKILYTGDLSINTQNDALKLWEIIRTNYGSIDALIVTGVSSSSDFEFLSSLHNSLLVQFWVVMAFLPGMLERNKGKIVSVSVDRISSLVNTGVMRTIFEEVQQRDTKVCVCLIEKNQYLEKILPRLPNEIVAKLISGALDIKKSLIYVPSLSHYWLFLAKWLSPKYWLDKNSLNQ